MQNNTDRRIQKDDYVEIKHTRQQYMDLCYIQCSLRTLGLYKGNIDGWFGKDSFDAIEQLTGETFDRPNGWMARDVFFTLQRVMCATGFGVEMNGVWTDESCRAFYMLVLLYRRRHQCMTYGPAWSRRSEITPEDWIQMKQWLTWQGRPVSHVGYLTSVVAYETDERFGRDMSEDGRPLVMRDYLSIYFQLLSGSRQISDCETFDHYALTSVNGYPRKTDVRKQYGNIVVVNSVGAADAYLWAGLHPINRALAAPVE